MGRPRKLTNKDVETILKLRAIGVPIAEIARKKEVSRPTIYTVINHIDRYLTEL